MSGYLEFDKTGNKELDAILEDIVNAADACSNWDEETANGKSYNDIINEKIEEVKNSFGY